MTLTPDDYLALAERLLDTDLDAADTARTMFPGVDPGIGDEAEPALAQHADLFACAGCRYWRDGFEFDGADEDRCAYCVEDAAADAVSDRAVCGGPAEAAGEGADAARP